MWLMSSKRYRAAWISSMCSQFGWAWVAYSSQLWGMFLFSFVMLAVAVRGLRNAPKGGK
jgi:hypothetical protein